MSLNSVIQQIHKVTVFQLENENGRTQGRALCAVGAKEGTFYRKQALKLVKNAQLCCHGTYKDSLLMH